METQEIYDHPAYRYAKDIQDGKIVVNEDIRLVTKRFIEEVDQSLKGEGDWYFDITALEKVTNILKLIVMATGTKRGVSVNDSLVGFQWYFIVNIFCWRHKENRNLRRYTTATLLIARKNSKLSLF